jgi:hypothetical protein
MALGIASIAPTCRASDEGEAGQAGFAGAQPLQVLVSFDV